MTSKYEVTKGMTFAVSDAPVTAEDFNASGFPGLVLPGWKQPVQQRRSPSPAGRKGIST
jgi:hypothetical protein